MMTCFPFLDCRAVGIDVSPLCMDMARNVAQEEGVNHLCTFYQSDATLDPAMLFKSGRYRLLIVIPTDCFIYSLTRLNSQSSIHN